MFMNEIGVQSINTFVCVPWLDSRYGSTFIKNTFLSERDIYYFLSLFCSTKCICMYSKYFVDINLQKRGMVNKIIVTELLGKWFSLAFSET